MSLQYTTWYGPWGRKKGKNGEKNVTAAEYKNLNLNLAD
jgi:hypothetical protein